MIDRFVVETQTADVYSFGIILWQLLTLKEPFTEYEFLDDFVRAVAVAHVRPPIPPDTTPVKTLLFIAILVGAFIPPQFATKR